MADVSGDHCEWRMVRDAIKVVNHLTPCV